MQNLWLPLYIGHLKSETWWDSQHKLLYLHQAHLQTLSYSKEWDLILPACGWEWYSLLDREEKNL